MGVAHGGDEPRLDAQGAAGRLLAGEQVVGQHARQAADGVEVDVDVGDVKLRRGLEHRDDEDVGGNLRPDLAGGEDGILGQFAGGADDDAGSRTGAQAPGNCLPGAVSATDGAHAELALGGLRRQGLLAGRCPNGSAYPRITKWVTYEIANHPPWACISSVYCV